MGPTWEYIVVILTASAYECNDSKCQNRAHYKLDLFHCFPLMQSFTTMNNGLCQKEFCHPFPSPLELKRIVASGLKKYMWLGGSLWLYPSNRKVAGLRPSLVTCLLAL